MAQACSFPRRREGTQEPGHEGRRYRRPGERRTERPYGATGETTIHSFNFWHIADVPGVREERRGVALPPLPGRGAAPHTPLISESAKIPFVYLCGSSCSSCFPQNTPPLSIAPPVARLSRVPFSVLRSPFSGATQSPSISPMVRRCARTPFCVLGGAMAEARSRSSGRALAMATELGTRASIPASLR